MESMPYGTVRATLQSPCYHSGNVRQQRLPCMTTGLNRTTAEFICYKDWKTKNCFTYFLKKDSNS